MSTNINIRLPNIKLSLPILFALFLLLSFGLNTLIANPDDTNDVTLTNENPCKIIYNPDECEEVRIDLTHDGDKSEYCVEATAVDANGDILGPVDVLSKYETRIPTFNVTYAK